VDKIHPEVGRGSNRVRAASLGRPVKDRLGKHRVVRDRQVKVVKGASKGKLRDKARAARVASPVSEPE